MLRLCPSHSCGLCGQGSLQGSAPAQTQAPEESFLLKGLSWSPWQLRQKGGDVRGNHHTGLIQSHHFWPDRLVNIYRDLLFQWSCFDFLPAQNLHPQVLPSKAVMTMD